tara:strand:- start:824 stop:1453 length:630 start_codon:yes stop_codon:yes gene_type:complete
MNYIPEPAFDSNNDNYFFALMTNSFHTASSQYEFNYAKKSYKSDFDNSILHGDENVFDTLYNTYDNNENKKLRYGWTPIMFSIWNQKDIFFYHLLKNYDIDLSSKTDSGQTVLHLVCMRKVTEFIRPLIMNGAHIYIKDNYGYTPIDYLKNYPINISEFIELYDREQRWIRRKYLFLINKYFHRCNQFIRSRTKVLMNWHLVRFISSFL